jgi:hypothetical protein
MTILLLKTTSNKTRFIALNRAVIPGFDLIDPLARDRNNRRRARDKIPSVGMLKSSDLLGHSKLPLGMSNNITIGGRLRKRDWRTWRLNRHRGRRCGRWWRTWATSIVVEDVEVLVEREMMRRVAVVV